MSIRINEALRGDSEPWSQEAIAYQSKGESEHVGITLGLWLSGIFTASLFLTSELGTSVIPSLARNAMAVVWPLIYFAFSSCKFVPRRLTFGTYVPLVGFAIFSALSVVISPIPYQSISYVLLTLITVWIVLQFNYNLDGKGYERGMTIFALVAVTLLVSYASMSYIPGARLGFGKGVLNANHIALLAMSGILSAMAIRAIPIRVLVLGLAIVVLALTGSRASAVATIIGLFIITYVRVYMARSNTTLLLAALIVLLVIAGGYYSDLILNFFNDYFAIHDRHRGLETGASGRTIAWSATWELFLANPILGVGFRAHEQLLRVATSSHNGYLAMLAEIGLPGFLCIMWLITAGCYRLWMRVWDTQLYYSHSILLGLCCGYLTLAMFERYLINVGNPASLLFLLGILIPSANIHGKPRG